MTAFWISFRIAEEGDYNGIYSDLYEAVKELAGDRWWTQTTSFYAFQSEHKSSYIAAILKAVIRPESDLLVVGSFDTKVCIIIGRNDDNDIYDFVTFAKRG